MGPNGFTEDLRAIRLLPLAQQGGTLLRYIEGIPLAQQRPVVLDLLERKQIPPTLTPAGKQTLAAAAGVSTALVDEGVDVATDPALTSLLKINPPTGTLDPVALNAAGETRKAFEAQLAAYPKPRLALRGITGTVEKVTGRLDSIDFEDGRRLVLSQPAVYELLFLQALDIGSVPTTDDAGVVDHILNHVDDDALLQFLRRVVDAVLAAQLIVLEEAEREDLARMALTRGLDLRIGKLTAAVLALVDIRRRQGSVPRFVDVYLAKQEIKPEAADERTRQAMIDYLVDLQLSMTYPAVVDGEFDEYFALAYDAARRQRAASDDPIDIARSGRRTGIGSDFSIRRISERETALVRPKAIHAAGALFSIFVEGELMRMFDLADALSLEWHRGGLDVSEGEVASLLNRIEHLRDDRPDDSERGMLYRRIFNYGEAEMLSGALVNERFGEHFDRLMYEVTRLVDLQDRAFNDPRQISRAGVVSAITSVQHNLSQFVTGSAFLKVEELLSYLNECQELLTSPPIVARYGGTEQSISSTLKNMGLTFLDASLPVEDLFELAERGNDVFNFVARFTRGNVREEPFQDFLDAAQQTIIARAAVDDGAWQPPDHDRDRWRRRRHRDEDEDSGDSGRNGRVKAPAGAIDEWDR